MVLWSSEAGTESSHNGVLDSGWTIPKQELTETVWEARMWEYDFPGQILASDGSEDNGVLGSVFIVLGNSVSTGSIRVVRTEEVTDSTRSEKTTLLEVLIGVNVKENLVVMMDN